MAAEGEGESEESYLPDVTITRADTPADGLRTYSGSAMRAAAVPYASGNTTVGWNKAAILSRQISNQNISSSSYPVWKTGEEHIQKLFEQTFQNSVSNSLQWYYENKNSSTMIVSGINAWVATLPFSVSAGDSISFDSFRLRLSCSSNFYVPDGLNNTSSSKYFVVGIMDSSYNLLNIIYSPAFSKPSVLQTSSAYYNVPDINYTFTSSFTDVRLCVWVGRSHLETSSTSLNYGCGKNVPSGSAYTFYFQFQPSDAMGDIVPGREPGESPDYSGFLGSIIEFIQGIYNAVVNLPNLISNVISAIGNAVTNVVNGIIEGLKTLFIPTGEQMQQVLTDFTAWLDENFPLLSTPVTLFQSVIQIISAPNSDLPSLTFPSIKFMGITFNQAYTFDFGDIPYLDDLIPYIRLILTVGLYASFFSWVWKHVRSIINGSSIDIDDGTFDFFNWGK